MSPSHPIPLATIADPSLPMAGGPEHERADAARNRRRVLESARRIVEHCGPEGLTTDAVARSAGVGKGTVFRRFGDRTGLMLALLDDTERAFQDAVLAGPAPLGPGAPSAERLVAFGRARIDLLASPNGTLFAAADAGGARRYRVPARAMHALHVRALLVDAGARGDVELLAEGLLAQLEAGLVRHLVLDRGLDVERLHDAWSAAVGRAVA